VFEMLYIGFLKVLFVNDDLLTEIISPVKTGK